MLLSWEATKELNHSKNSPGFSLPSSLLTSEYQVREAKSTSLKIKRIEFAFPSLNPGPSPKLREMDDPSMSAFARCRVRPITVMVRYFITCLQFSHYCVEKCANVSKASMLWCSNSGVHQSPRNPSTSCVPGPSPGVSDLVGLGWDQEFANLKSSQVPGTTPGEPWV